MPKKTSDAVALLAIQPIASVQANRKFAGLKVRTCLRCAGDAQQNTSSATVTNAETTIKGLFSFESASINAPGIVEQLNF
jgi:hypothetical protein